MARAAAKLGVRELGAAAKVSPNTITRAEADGALNPSTIAAIQRALEAAGIEFLYDTGVRLKAQAAPSKRPTAGSAPGNTKAPTSAKKIRARSAPKAKALPMSKDAQIRALREQGA
jgi:transcriptional regulator with XRE-family HTH domain